MKKKILICIIAIFLVLLAAIPVYRYYFVNTLMLSQVLGKTDNALANLAINAFDFDTGLTRHDIKQLNDKKDYWITRINKLDEIQDADQKQQATIQLLSDFLDEPVVKKLKSKLIALSPESSLDLIKTIIQN
jgi:hypothetical protein